MSESPASRMAMVEQRKSLPQAVPSSICVDTLVCSSPKSCSDLFSEPTLRVYPVSQCISSLGHERIGVGTYVVAREVVDGGLGQHGVVLELRLAERGSVAGNDDKLGLASAEALEGGLVTEGDPYSSQYSAHFVVLRLTYFPDFITSARRELMESAVLLLFLGAIVAYRKWLISS